MQTMYVALAGLAVTVLANFAAIVGFAATIRAAVTQLNATTGELRDAVRLLQRADSDHERRLAVLEDRQQRPFPVGAP